MMVTGKLLREVVPSTEIMVPGRKARSRRFSHEQIERGFGTLVLNAPDFPRADRDRLASEIVGAYEAGTLSPEILPLAHGVCCALQAPCATLEALRAFLRADGAEMVARVRELTRLIPQLVDLLNWI